MGTGYWILLWDGWGAGLVMLNPRLHTDGVDCYGNPRNWFPLPNGEEMANGHDLRAKHGITAKHFQPIDFNDWLLSIWRNHERMDQMQRPDASTPCTGAARLSL